MTKIAKRRNARRLLKAQRKAVGKAKFALASLVKAKAFGPQAWPQAVFRLEF